MSNSIRLEDILQIEKAMDEAREDETPFAVYGKHDNDVIEVIGNANKTEVKSTNFNISFRYRKDELPAIPAGAKLIGNHFVVFSHEFEDVTLSVASDMVIVSAMMDILPFFAELEQAYEERGNKISLLEKQYSAKIQLNDDKKNVRPQIIIGDESKRAELEKKVDDVLEHFVNYTVKLYIDGGDKLQLGLYNLVASMLQIDDDLGAHMMPASVIKATINILKTYPEVFNEAESLFGLS